MSPKSIVSPSRGASWHSVGSFTTLTPTDFYSQMLWGLPGSGTLGWVCVLWLGSLLPRSPSQFFFFLAITLDADLPIPHVHTSPPLLCIWMNVAFLNPSIVRLPYSLIFPTILGDICFVV